MPSTGADAPHIPVLIDSILEACAPIGGTWIDGTLGAGGYARALLDAGAARVVGIDRDPLAHDMARGWGAGLGERLRTVQANFAEMDDALHAALGDGAAAGGVVLDLGVSSMQLDRAERGFSFLRDGPLDMRMGPHGPTAADLVNGAPEGELADILFLYGEERASRRIASAIARARAEAPFETTGRLAELVAAQLPRPKPGQSHPATRTFQALRIAVNDEFGALEAGLAAAERVLMPGGWLAVVSFHSLEDRIVKRFLKARGKATAANRYAPPEPGALTAAPAFDSIRSVGPSEAEVAANPRARSARLRVARRTDAPAGAGDPDALGVPRPRRTVGRGGAAAKGRKGARRRPKEG